LRATGYIERSSSPISAAAAERSGLVVLHYDHDFDRIAAVTDQAMEWVVPSGTADES